MQNFELWMNPLFSKYWQKLVKIRQFNIFQVKFVIIYNGVSASRQNWKLGSVLFFIMWSYGLYNTDGNCGSFIKFW